MKVKKLKLQDVDNLFSKLVRQRDGKCLKCGKTENLQCSHVLPRTYMVTRWDMNNAITLCYADHIHWWHKHPLEAAEWFEERFPGRYKALRKLALTYKKQDRKAVYEQLQELSRKSIDIHMRDE